MLNFTKPQDFGNNIDITYPHQVVSSWELTINCICQGNNHDIWSRYIERLVSRVIPSARIKQEIDEIMDKLPSGYCRIEGTITGKSIPTTIIELVEAYVPTPSPRIYQDKWMNVDQILPPMLTYMSQKDGSGNIIMKT